MKIFVCVGDLSGEGHVVNVIREIRDMDSKAVVTGVGGEWLKGVCDEFLFDVVDINAFGFLPIRQIFILRRVLAKIKESFLRCKPDKVVLVDYYGFNVQVAKLAKSLNIPVYYFISPQVWASRSGRILTLQKLVKKMMVIFPFEERLYRDKGVDAVFVGNPLIDTIEQKQQTNISNPPVIGLFPGSRKDTIKRHLPIIINVAQILKSRLNASFILFSSDPLISNLPDFIKIEKHNDPQIRKSIDFAICPSGTVSLENALYGVPMVVMYRLSYINYFIIRLLIKIKYITIANILAGKLIVPEFIQHNAKAQKIADCVIEQLEAKNYQARVRELTEIRSQLGTQGVSKRVAEIICS
jgi:lipid-A-disaccharide synthase